MPRRLASSVSSDPERIEAAKPAGFTVVDAWRRRRSFLHRRQAHAASPSEPQRLEPIALCVREGLVPDFYFKTLHRDRYWSAHPPENRRDLEMDEPNSDDHGYYHDNLFCDRSEATVALMQEVRVPWIAFKVLGCLPAPGPAWSRTPAGRCRPASERRYPAAAGWRRTSATPASHPWRPVGRNRRHDLRTPSSRCR